MELKFLGRGAAFNKDELNTSAYFLDNNDIYLIDCGELIFSEINKTNLLKDKDNINLLITHTHSDHCGSLGSLVLYCHFVLNKKLNIIINKDSLILEDIKTIIRIMGCSEEMYNIVYDTDVKSNVFNRVYFVKTDHTGYLNCYSIVFETDNGIIYYSGDTRELNYLKELIDNNYNIDKIYVDTCSSNYPGNAHLYVGLINEYVPKELNNKVYCMHLNNKECEDLIKEYNFNLVSLQ